MAEEKEVVFSKRAIRKLKKIAKKKGKTLDEAKEHFAKKVIKKYKERVEAQAEGINCSNCKNFDETRYKEHLVSKGFCNAQSRILTRLDYDYCLDFVPVILKIEEVVIPSD